MSDIILLTIIHAPASVCFDLSCSIDLHKISTQQTSEEAIDGRTSSLIKAGEFVTWRAKHFGFWLKLSTIITAYERPFHFRDEQRKGPFSYLQHDHFFTEENGITTMKDHFSFASPFGIFGKIADRLFVKKHLQKLLLHRNATIKHFAESGKWKNIPGMEDILIV